jgi:hypothetical protein
MRIANDSIDERTRERLWRVYSSYLGRSASVLQAADSPAVAPRDLLLTYRWLFTPSNRIESDALAYRYLLARLEEAAGDSGAALASYRAARAQLTDSDDNYRRSIDSAVARLTR